MSIAVKIACVLMLATSAFAEGNAFTDNAIPAMASAGAVAAANATVPSSEIPGDNRTVVLIMGIAAVAVTFHRVLFRGRQAA
ncbi:hypothetical protein DES53_10563 [Roseimicrobium gellanilyticum]|uniref:Virion coat protein B n=1 Tax=Roseimicrobium gellanilyticum TaxID=748857 RepID=A0A366HNV9_9BACT|nr:hypothetical protein [Roseimicrobium gellanilyticum]RBP43665.1 hypothetical protein DES53_10563 [Roseimicrobium gellanilyticum]